ncbi:MAG: hypothetical protein RIS73_797, partial [Bacteroidota bacterium]
MKKIMLIAFYCISFTALFAQKPITAQPVVAVVKPVPPPIVSTKELKKQLESNFKRKKYKNVIPIADTLLT